MKWEHSLQGQKPALCTSQGSMSPLQLPCGLSIPAPAALSSPLWESYWGCGSVFTWVLPDAEPETRIQMQVIYLGSASKPAGGWGREIYLYIHSHTNIKKKEWDQRCNCIFSILSQTFNAHISHKKNQEKIIFRKTGMESSKDLQRFKYVIKAATSVGIWRPLGKLWEIV